MQVKLVERVLKQDYFLHLDLLMIAIAMRVDLIPTYVHKYVTGVPSCAMRISRLDSWRSAEL